MTAVELCLSQHLALGWGQCAQASSPRVPGAGAWPSKYLGFKGDKAYMDSSRASFHWPPWKALVSCFLPFPEKGEGKRSSQNLGERTKIAGCAGNSSISLYFYFPDGWGGWGQRWVYWEAVPLCSCVFELMGQASKWQMDACSYLIYSLDE